MLEKRKVNCQFVVRLDALASAECDARSSRAKASERERESARGGRQSGGARRSFCRIQPIVCPLSVALAHSRRSDLAPAQGKENERAQRKIEDARMHRARRKRTHKRQLAISRYIVVRERSLLLCRFFLPLSVMRFETQTQRTHTEGPTDTERRFLHSSLRPLRLFHEFTLNIFRCYTCHVEIFLLSRIYDGYYMRPII